MTRKSIIVEGYDDQQLLAAILPNLAPQVRLVAAGGYSAALSKAATVLSYLHEDAFLVLDADTIDDIAALEKQQFVYDYLKSSRNGSRFELILFKPTLLDYLSEYAGVATKIAEGSNNITKFTRIQQVLSEIHTNRTMYQELLPMQRIIEFVQ